MTPVRWVRRRKVTKKKERNDHTMADFAGSLAVFLPGLSPMIVWPCQ